VIGAVLVLALVIGPGPAARHVAAQTRDSFPHAAHRRLFTSCTTCHAGIPTGDSATARPPTSFCGTCHDGRDQRLVDWTPVPARASNLRYDHVTHIAAVRSKGDEELPCTRCHAMGDAEGELMEVARARPERCITCHAHQADTHLAEGSACATCHRPLADVRGLASARIAAFPKPASHDQPRFGRAHVPGPGQAAGQCATCHTRESCLACHGSDAHTAAIALIPRAGRDGPRVNLGASRPPDHVARFAVDHRAAAASGDQACQSCHTQRYCATCHDAASRPPFHATNFVMRHGSSAFTQDNECAACHQTQVFCRDCHSRTGRGTDAAPFGSYHTSQPNWRFGHAAAARRSIETCASCHAQSFCLSCHSARQGQGVSPHGPGFNPAMAGKNPAMCRICHVTIPS
jgi:hypothetical protein